MKDTLFDAVENGSPDCIQLALAVFVTVCARDPGAMSNIRAQRSATATARKGWLRPIGFSMMKGGDG
ncbi:hypothetical protein [Sphingomonas oligophenolica]|uniref:hypothetical protein n=1 Tax=Sphingomonas oligophenolica TaxID=301154 RepID=UPI0031D09332